MTDEAPRPAPLRPVRALLWRWRHALVLAPFLLLVLTGTRGADFGRHWDERLHLDRAQEVGASGTLLPHAYAYPSVCHWMSLAPAVPMALRAWRDDQPAARPALRALQLLRDRAGDFQYKLATRRLFTVVSSLAVLWTYLAVALSRRSHLEALLAASLLGTSFEFATHARWVAPDAVATQFGALVLAGAMGALAAPAARRWLLVAAVAAGLACGTKYNAGLLLLPVGLAWLASRARQRGSLSWLAFGVALVGAFALTVVLTTPGIVLEPRALLDDVHREMDHYASRHEQDELPSVYTVTPGRPHLRAMLRYLSEDFFSTHAGLARAVALLALVGAVGLVAETGLASLVVFAMPAAYLWFFSTRSVMIVRNTLLVTPFLALLAARGGAMVAALVPLRAWRVAVGLALAGAVAFNARVLVASAETIATRRADAWVAELDGALRRDPGGRYMITPTVAQGFASHGLPAPPNTSLAYVRGQRGVVLMLSERSEREREAAWEPLGELRLRWFGPREVNLSWYPSWPSDADRAVLLTNEQAARFGLCPECAPLHAR